MKYRFDASTIMCIAIYICNYIINIDLNVCHSIVRDYVCVRTILIRSSSILFTWEQLLFDHPQLCLHENNVYLFDRQQLYLRENNVYHLVKSISL